MLQLNNKVFIVTGAGSGIGRALAIKLDQEGAKLALNDINADALKETASMLNQAPLEMAFSVTEQAQWDRFKEAVLAQFGSVDGIINNAGISHEAVTAEHLREADLKQIMDINFYGVVFGTQTFLPEIKKSPAGSIVNISSIFGVTAVALQSAYCASKFAVRGYTESLRMEALSYYPNLTVSCVHPGGIDTPIADNVIQAGSRTKEERDRDSAKFKKSFVTPPAVAAKTIVDGIAKKQTRILIGMDAKLLDWTARAMPGTYSKHILSHMKKRGLVDSELLLPIDKRA
jgi:NAD(P)-dependent dehydrogenase (short-subunit alcohol dehydrogenase family)